MVRVAVIDYGMGNLHSIVNALKYIGADTTVCTDDSFVNYADLVVLPGVGTFSEGMKGLIDRKQDQALKNFANTGRGILGICLGCQLLLSSGEEFGTTAGLQLIPGKVTCIPFSGAPIPHVGWKKINVLDQKKNYPITNLSWGYFVHSYHCEPDDPDTIIATVKHGSNSIVAIIAHNNVYGFQFHPEKSGSNGLSMLKNFCSLWG